MLFTFRFWGFCFTCLLVAVSVMGCGTRKVKVHGKLTYGATPVKGAEREPLVVTFSPYNGEGKPDGKPVAAEVNQEAGTYEATVPVGKLRICISRFQADLTDQFNGTFAQGQSPILKDVSEDAEINVDFSQYRSQMAGGIQNIPMPGDH